MVLGSRCESSGQAHSQEQISSETVGTPSSENSMVWAIAYLHENGLSTSPSWLHVIIRWRWPLASSDTVLDLTPNGSAAQNSSSLYNHLVSIGQPLLA